MPPSATSFRDLRNSALQPAASAAFFVLRHLTASIKVSLSKGMTELRLGLLSSGASGWRALSSAKWAAASTAPGDERALDAAEKSPALARDCARLYLLKEIRGAQAREASQGGLPTSPL